MLIKNDFEVRGDVTIIFLDRKVGPRIETRVNTHHLPYLQSLPYKFFGSWDNKTKSYYVVYHMKTADGKDSIRSLHRLLMGDPTDGKVIDHWDRDTLNNLDSNLKVVTQCQNMMNRGLWTRNTTGFKGVSYCQRTGQFIAQIKIDKKHYWLGRHDTPEQAHAAYIAFRDSKKVYINTEVQ